MTVTLDPLVILVVRLALALLFAAAAWHKVREWPRTGAIVAAYRIVPDALAYPAALAVIGAEFALAGALLVSTAALYPAAALLGCYGVAIGINVARGNDRIDCGCLGFGARAPRLRRAMVARNGAMAAAALLAALSAAAARPLGWLDMLSLGAALVILGFLYVALETALTLPRRKAAS